MATVDGYEESNKVEPNNIARATEAYLPLLYQKREYLIASEHLSGSATSCETTSPKGTLDYGPDD